MRRRTLRVEFSRPAATAYGAKPLKPEVGGIPMRTIGKTGEKVTVIGQAGGRYPLISFEDAKAITLRAYDLGINSFRQLHRLLGRPVGEVLRAVLPPFRKNIFLTTKANQRKPRRRSGGTRPLPQAHENRLR